MEHQILLVLFIVNDWPAMSCLAGLGSFHSDHLGFDSNEYTLWEEIWSSTNILLQNAKQLHRFRKDFQKI